MLRAIFPTFGPRSGGTQLSVHGQNLKIGSQLAVYASSRLCTVIRYQLTEFLSVTVRLSEHGDLTIGVSQGPRACPGFLFGGGGKTEGREQGWGSWGGQQPISPPARGSGERSELRLQGSGRIPDRPKVFLYFQHSG